MPSKDAGVQKLTAAQGTDTVYAIEAVNPELADIIKSLKTTYAVLGGQFEDNTKTLDTATFDGRRTLIQHELHRVCGGHNMIMHAARTIPCFFRSWRCSATQNQTLDSIHDLKTSFG